MPLSLIPLLSSQLLFLQTHTPLALPSIQPATKGNLHHLNHDAGNEVSNAIVRPHLKIFHPSSNSCIFRQLYEDSLKLAPCEQADSWKYTPQKFLTVAGTYYCLKAVGPALPAKLSIACEVSDSQWTPLTGSQTTHLMTQMKDGTALCLDVDEDKTIVTNLCRSFSSDANAIENDSQWFQISAFSYKKD